MYFWLKCHNCSRVLAAGGFSPGARSNDYGKEVDKYNNELHTLELNVLSLKLEDSNSHDGICSPFSAIIDFV